VSLKDLQGDHTILILSPVLAWGKTNPVDYAVAVHVQSSHLIYTLSYLLDQSNWDQCQQLDVVIDGKKYVWISKDYPDFALMIGGCKAKLLPDDFHEGENPPKSYEYHQNYEFLFPDGKTRKYVVVGATE
jgi:hypothetical protein